MLQITQAAIDNILEYFTDRDIQPVRVFLNPGGWGGPSMNMALDDAKTTDFQHKDESGVIILVDNDLFSITGEIIIDFTGMGFNIQTANTLVSGEDAGCGGCDGGGSACPGKV